jgi:flagellar hook assembly protein FlgD
VTIRIYNLLGQEVRQLVDENQLEGFRTAKWDGRNNAGVPVSSGVYLYRLQATTIDATSREFTAAQKMIVLR